MDFLTSPLPFNIAGSEGCSSPAELGNDRLGRAMTWGGGTANITIDLGYAAPVDTMALLAGMNLVDGDLVRWRAANTLAAVAAGTAPGPYGYDSGSLPYLASPEGEKRVHRQHIRKLPSPISFRYWLVSITHATAASLSIGRLVLGRAFEPDEPRDYDWEMRVVDLGNTQRSATGLDDSLIRGKVLEYSWEWSGLTKQEASGLLLDVSAYAGNTRDILVCLDPTATDAHNLIGYGKLQEGVVTRNYAEGWYSAPCTLQSRLVLNL